MRYLFTHFRTIIDGYNGELPLAHFLKDYFRQFPILGSRDRKLLSGAAYGWFRCAGTIGDNDLLFQLAGQWMLEKSTQTLTDWIMDKHPEVPMQIEALFRHTIACSDGISKQEWLASMLIQPNLFIRIRKDKGKIISLLNNAGIPSISITDTCLSLPNGAKIDALLPPDSYVVQDASSQKTGDWFKPKKNELWYDCCSGAGGKSLLLKDLEPGVRLTVSDRRESIIHNLQQRFRLYRHEMPVAYVADISDKEQLKKNLSGKRFDTIICDAPCTGSGTWARTPEQLHFFDPVRLPDFASRQLSIATHVADYLKPGGRLIYITCSVFKNENESVTEEVCRQTGLQLTSSQLINGTGIHADSMYLAELKK